MFTAWEVIGRRLKIIWLVHWLLVASYPHPFNKRGPSLMMIRYLTMWCSVERCGMHSSVSTPICKSLLPYPHKRVQIMCTFDKVHLLYLAHIRVQEKQLFVDIMIGDPSVEIQQFLDRSTWWYDGKRLQKIWLSKFFQKTYFVETWMVTMIHPLPMQKATILWHPLLLSLSYSLSQQFTSPSLLGYPNQYY